jgi:gas vesicle protein
MNDTKQDTNDTRSIAPVLVGFALGAVVGGVAALLLAPASGENTRRRLGDAARRLSREARDTLGEARETVSGAASGLAADVKSAVSAGRDAFRHSGEAREHSVPRIAELGNPPRTP